MRRCLQPVLVYASLVLYSSTMLLGPRLHELVGCDHDHAAHLAEQAAAGQSESKGPAAHSEDHDADTCPICQFHGQAQCSSPLVEAPRLSLICYGRAVETYVSLPLAIAHSYSSRAPPLV